MRIALMTLALVAVACNGGSPATPPDPGPAAQAEPCDLVTEDEAEAALDGTLQPGEPTSLDELGEGCVFDGPDGRVTVVVYSDPLTAEELLAEDAPGAVVEGIGEAAYYYELTGDLKVVVDGAMFHVGVFPALQPSRAGAEELAAIAATRV